MQAQPDAPSVTTAHLCDPCIISMCIISMLSELFTSTLPTHSLPIEYHAKSATYGPALTSRRQQTIPSSGNKRDNFRFSNEYPAA
ncbi:hypothetical protein CCM_01360 [Cordyceps militaris CM01]|uniref:Uncharacterized protein n=1 Tax=Cordyceps militaris (strain CM01) TaxID=983644 RepID=G3J4N7_CORMM|nr:uncharacterized protein CCM_01360 [Cordyceps militaris CM01]EGX96702.1 hypothetical protein CCM_01360 [Cordyceps militaris CM01]